ncbi:ribonuclease P protein component [Psychrobacter sp. FDAARGOS_221]|uniref:ribonuclease P protein component n=1 Tax=Psychrobacter sp. FDAARGOS_221 TaxID=1975705 RepID=UPI000BB5358B|nr:ribonuclease P protein component [Psychrobacter sp. FDAARGOS_221]PNK60765.1 ribonuclease P protein component [Psychrobacter sp. FDAARGOS_221]
MTDYCYPKTKRLLKPAEFKQVFNQPLLKVHQIHFMAFAYPSDRTQARLGMAITKKKISTAVARNRVKRIIREQFRHSHAQLPALDLVFIVKKSPKALTNAQLQQEIQDLLGKIKHKHKVLQQKQSQDSRQQHG